MAPRPVVTAELIAALRTRAVSHNAVFPEAPAKLNDLKKAWIHGWHRARGSRMGAEAAVDKHLKKLAALAASPASVEALAKAEFDESQHRRDGDGKFAPKGGAPASYAGVRTPAQHQQARRENEGYRAATTQVIPETRGTLLAPLGGVAAGVMLGAVRGYRADKMPGAMLRLGHAALAWPGARVAGAFAGAGRSVGERVANTMRRAAGEAEVDVVDAAGKTARVVRRKVYRGTRKALDWGTKASLVFQRSAIDAAKKDITRQGLTGSKAKLRMTQARAQAAFMGAAFPGAPMALVGYKAGELAGPAYDALFPRRVEKVLALPADPRSVEVLAKAAPVAALRSLGSKIPKTGAKGAYAIGRRFFGQAVERPRSVGVGALLGGGAGAALGAAGAFGARRYYRDKDGKFTSKERDVGTVGAIAGGAALGALAGFSFVRGKNRALAREIAERLGNLKASVATAEKTGPMSLAEIRSGIARGKIKPEDVVLPEGMPGARRAAAARGKITEAASKARDKIVEARVGAYRNAAAGGPDAWQEFQVEERLRDSLAALRGKMAFASPPENLRPKYNLVPSKKPGGKPKKELIGSLTPEWKAYQAGRRLLSAEPVARTVGKGRAATRTVIDDPIGETIAAIRGLDPAQVRNPTYLAGLKTGVPDFDDLTLPQKRMLVRRVTAADAAIGEFRAANQANAGLRDASKEAASKAAKLRADIDAGEKSGLAEEALSALRAAKATADTEMANARNAVKAATSPTIRNPFGGQIEALPEAAKLEQYLDNVAARIGGLTPAEQAAIGRTNKQAIEGLLSIYGRARQAGNMDPGRVGRAVRRVTAPIGRFGRQVGLISGDVRAAVSPRMKAAWEAAQRMNASAIGTKDAPGTLRTAARNRMADATAIKGWMKENPKTVPAIIAGLSGAFGVVDVMSDGKLNFRFDKMPDAYKHLADKKHRPQAAMYFLNGGRDVAYVMTGRSIGTKDMPATDIILSGTVIRQNGAAEDATPLMPLKMFLDNNRGGNERGGQGQKGAVQIDPRDAKEYADALRALGDKVQKTDDEDGYAFRANDDNTQNGPAGKLLSAIVAVAPNKRSNQNEDFYTYLGSIFGEHGGLLQERQMRNALFGGKRRDKDGNEKPYQGIFDQNGDAARGYQAQDAKKLFAGLKDKIEKVPAPNDDQARLLRHMVTLMAQPKSHTRLTEEHANELRSLIETRRASRGEGAAPPVTKASGGRRGGDADTAIRAEEDSLGLHIHTILGGSSSSPAYMKAQQTAASALFKEQMGALIEQNPGADMVDLAREARITATEKFLRDWAKQQNLAGARLKAIDDYIAGIRKSWAPADLAKVMTASTALLAKADVAPPGPRRPFEEGKVRRSPRGDDRGGEFASKGGGGGGKPPAQRQQSPRPGARRKEDDRSYFEPVRLGGTLGSAAGSQAGWEIASRFLPGPLRHAGIVGRLAYRLGSSMAGGVAGQMGGEAAGRATYERPARAPGSYEPKARSFTEEAVRMVGGGAGGMLSFAAKSPMRGFAVGVGGQLAGEELAAAAHSIVTRYYPEAAARTGRAAQQRPPA